ncbi:MAG: excinuclease ABC subunit UvrC [Coprobacter sp.]|nr:excinuclease ABC subunit UvrC [Coprobacter sp.]
MATRDEHIKQLLSLLPDSPGVYQYYDKEGTLLYVGKAKNLKRRVHSYFNKVHESQRTNILVRKIHDIKYIVVASEEDALHLENALIKEHKPFYNVMLKDDKTYPWITIRQEPFPRIFLTRKVIHDGSRYYGPYANVQLARTVLELIRALYPIRTCSHLLTPENINRHKYKLCLQYHIKNCKGACEGLESEEEYLKYITQVRQILSGNIQQLSEHLRNEMQQLSEQLKFEEAQEIKEKYLLIEKYKAKSVIVSASIHNVDVYSYDEEENESYVNYMHVRNGSIVQSYTIEYRKKLDESKEEILSLAIAELRTRFKSLSREVIVPFLPESEFENIQFTIPIRGDKKQLLLVSEKNVKQYKIDKQKIAEKLNPEQRVTRILSQAQKDFRLHNLPMHIECFDNSNIQGTLPVSACVVFKKAKPSKKDYRHFNVKTVEGPDDYATMYEVITRRYRRLVEENAPLPDLIVVDGGKGQLHAAFDALKDLSLDIPLIGIAERLENIFFPDDPTPLFLDKNSESLRLIQQMRDEAHRFGITHHRNRRSKKQTESALDHIKGIGPKTRDALLSKYKSVKRIKEVPLQELSRLIGEKKAIALLDGLNNNNLTIKQL